MGSTFYLGTHMEGWLKRPGLPLFVSHRRLLPRGRLPRAARHWALDSGAFTEIAANGRHRTAPGAYARAVRTYCDEIGLLDWAAPQDWMCEPAMIAKTGYSVALHQRLTVENFLELLSYDPSLPFIPVLQGWTADDYLRCVELYRANGVDLAAFPTVGVGSVCRRQSTDEIGDLMARLADTGLRLHGFGVKTLGLVKYGRYLTSADSMAWSIDARRSPRLNGCRHSTCANCERWAERWRENLLRQLASEWQ